MSTISKDGKEIMKPEVSLERSNVAALSFGM
jgi:hypothetical protein